MQAIRAPKEYQSLPANELAALEAWLSTFYPFQAEWMLDASDMALCNKSRQIGLSHSTSGVGVLWGAFRGELTTIISIGDRESVEVLDKARKHARVLERLGSRMARITGKDNDNEVAFASGGRILALPSSGGRGFAGNVFLDEYAYQPHASKVWDAAAAVTMLGWKLRVASTPNGVGNEFHDLVTLAGKPNSGWSRYEIPIQRAIADGYPIDMGKCWTIAKNDPRLFSQLFECSFLDNVLQYIPSEAIESCLVDDLSTVPEGQHYAGLDIGRENDLTVLIVLRLVRGVRHLVHVESTKRTDSDSLEAMVDRSFEKYKLRRLCLDSTGLGTFPADRIKKKHSERVDVAHRRPRVEPITFTPQTKDTLATRMYAALTGQNVLLPRTDAALPGIQLGTAKRLQKDVAAIQRIVTSSGGVKYDAPRTAEGHADHAWALALALHACSTTNPMIEALDRRLGR